MYLFRVKSSSKITKIQATYTYIIIHSIYKIELNSIFFIFSP